MIKKKFFMTREDGMNLYRSYSDLGKLMRKVGTDEAPYEEAIDIEGANYQYIEIEEEEEDLTY